MSNLLEQIWNYIKENPWLFLLIFGIVALIISALGIVPFSKSLYRIDIYGRVILFCMGLLAFSFAAFKLGRNRELTISNDALSNELILCGVKNAFRNPTGIRQKEINRLIKEEVENTGKFRLLAMSGYSYLNPNGDVWKHAGLSKAITEENATFEVILQSPFSFFAFNRAIANRVEHSHWDEKQKPQNLIELLNYSSNINIRVTEYAINCSLFFTSKSVLYDFYLWSAPNSSDRTENNFMALEFQRVSGSKNDSYRLLEKHYEFLFAKSIPFEEFLHSPEPKSNHVYGREFYQLYKSNPELALNRYAMRKNNFHRTLIELKDKPQGSIIGWDV